MTRFTFLHEPLWSFMSLLTVVSIAYGIYGYSLSFEAGHLAFFVTAPISVWLVFYPIARTGFQDHPRDVSFRLLASILGVLAVLFLSDFLFGLTDIAVHLFTGECIGFCATWSDFATLVLVAGGFMLGAVVDSYGLILAIPFAIHQFLKQRLL